MTTRQTPLSLAVQYNAEGDEEPPSRSRVRALIRAALPDGGDIGVRFVGAAESARYNKQYRGKSGATNVLSFHYGKAESGGIRGDIVVCAPLAEREAALAKMPPANHYAHLIVHAALHLCGYLHESESDAAVMQKAERGILRRFAITAAPHLR
ncbi:MAG: rRNA maturation RNase YbeY [Gammaproteobacteria bacterium]